MVPALLLCTLLGVPNEPQEPSWPPSIDLGVSGVLGYRFSDPAELAAQVRFRTGLLLPVKLGPTERWLLMVGPMLRLSDGPSMFETAAGFEVELSTLWGPWAQTGLAWTLTGAYPQAHLAGGVSLFGLDLSLGSAPGTEAVFQVSAVLRIPVGALIYLLTGGRGESVEPFPYGTEDGPSTEKQR